MSAFRVVFILFFVLFLTNHARTLPTLTDNNCGPNLNFEKTTIRQLINIVSAQEDVQFKESVACLWKKKGLVTEDGRLIMDNFKKALLAEFRLKFPDDSGDEKTYEVLNYCRNIRGKNAGDTSVKMIRCLYRWEVQSFIDNERKESS